MERKHLVLYWFWLRHQSVLTLTHINNENQGEDKKIFLPQRHHKVLCNVLSHGLTTYQKIWRNSQSKKRITGSAIKDFRVIDYQGILEKGYGLLATKFKDYWLFASNYKLGAVLGLNPIDCFLHKIMKKWEILFFSSTPPEHLFKILS